MDHCTRLGTYHTWAKICFKGRKSLDGKDVYMGWVPCFVSDMVLWKLECFHRPVSILMSSVSYPS